MKPRNYWGSYDDVSHELADEAERDAHEAELCNPVSCNYCIEERMEEKTNPKFKVGQVVMMKGIKREAPFKILEIVPSDWGWFYRWDRKNCAAENTIRELTEDEKG